MQFHYPWSKYAAGGWLRERADKKAPSRLVLFLTAAAICALTVTIVSVSEWRERERRLATARDEAGRVARLLEEQTAGTIWATDLALLGLAESLRRDPTLPPHDPAFERSLRRLLLNLPAVRALFVVGRNGFIVQDSDRDTPRRNLADRDYFAAHLDGPSDTLFIGRPLISRSVGTWFIGLSRRVETPQDEFAGVVVAALEARYFERFYGELGLGDGDVITLATRDGILVARWPRADERVGKLIVDGPNKSALIAGLTQSSTGTFEADSVVDGTARIYGYRALSHHPLVVMVGLSRNRVLAPWYRGAAAAAAATIAAFALAGLMLWLAMRHARREAEVETRIREVSRLEAVGQLTSGVAHDFNNLLQVMAATLRLLGKLKRDEPRAAQLIEQGLSSVERGGTLVAQLLGVARRHELRSRELDVNALLTGMATLLRNAAKPNARVELDLAADLQPCQADPSRLEAAVLNLVVNARDALLPDRAGERIIRISTANCTEPAVSLEGRTLDAGRYVRVTVKDNGIGMPAEIRRRAMEPFFTTKGERGTGLGLAQVYTFVREVGGDLQIESQVNAGTAVHVYLAVRAA